jgi:polysaccharide export outer membrane protein
MREARILLAILGALALAACARQQQTYVIDPQTGQPVPVLSQQQQQDLAQPNYTEQGGGRGLFSSSPAFAQQNYAQPQYAEQSSGRGLLSSPPAYAQQTYAQQTYQPAAEPPPQAANSRGLFSSSPAYAQQTYEQQQYGQPVYQPQPAPSGRGLFNSSGGFWSSSAPRAYAAAPQSYVLQYQPPATAAPQYAAPVPAPQYATPQQYAAPQYAVPAPQTYAYAPAGGQPPYTLDSGDKLRVVVFGQAGISNSYLVDAGGNVNMPLIGTVPARGFSTQQLTQMIAERLKQGYVRDPHVSVEIEAYRPFFILGEVTNPGQYPYVANMTAETAVAIAGGFAPRASKRQVELTRNAPGQQVHADVPLNTPLRPGDTIVVKERWF